MLKKLSYLILILCGLTMISCANSSKKINDGIEKELETTTEESTEKKLAEKLIKKYESQGIKFSEDQIGQIKKIVDEMYSKEDTKENRNAIKRKVRANIDNNVLTDAQRGMIKKRKK